MRRVLYGGAMSLDAFIAGPNGEYDWIVMDPDIDFESKHPLSSGPLRTRCSTEARRRQSSTVPRRGAC